MTMGQVMAMGVDGVAEEAMVGEEASEEEVVSSSEERFKEELRSREES